MPRYAVAGLTIASDLALPELGEPDADGAHGWTFRFVGSLASPDLPVLINESHDQAGALRVSLERAGTRYLVRFAALAEFSISPVDRRVECVRLPGADDDAVRHLLIDQIVPHLLALDGSLVLHASAVGIAGGALAFTGLSGAGKSSLAAAFATAGAPLLADDFVHLSEGDDGFSATPSYPGLRLWPDSAARFARDGVPLTPVAGYTSKRRLASGGSSGRPLALTAVIVLGEEPPGDTTPLTIERLSSREAFWALFGQVFRAERSGRERTSEEFDRVARLVTSVPVLRLRHRRRYDLLDQVQAGILDTLGIIATAPP